MTVISLMAAELDRKLQERGIFSLGRAECEAIVTRLLALPAELGNTKPMTKEDADEISRRST
jgi:hypothetical protein